MSRILITGATGYIGGRLLKALEASGYQLRCLARKPEYLKSKVAPATEVIAGEVANTESLEPALASILVFKRMLYGIARRDCRPDAYRR